MNILFLKKNFGATLEEVIRIAQASCLRWIATSRPLKRIYLGGGECEMGNTGIQEDPEFFTDAFPVA